MRWRLLALVVVLYLLTGSFVLWAISAEGTRDGMDPDLDGLITIWFGTYGLYFLWQWFSYWQAAVVTGLFTLAAAVVWQRFDSLPLRRARNGRCTACNYDLFQNSSGRCPECGRPISPVQPSLHPWRVILLVAALHSVLSVATAYVAFKTTLDNDATRIAWEWLARILLSPLIWFRNWTGDPGFSLVACNSLLWAIALVYGAHHWRRVLRHPALLVAIMLLLLFFHPLVKRQYRNIDLKAIGFFNFDQRLGTIESVPMQMRLLDGQRVRTEGFMYDPTNSIRSHRFQLIYDIAQHPQRPPLVQERIFAVTPLLNPARCTTGFVRVSGVLHVSVKHNDAGDITSLFEMDVEKLEPVRAREFWSALDRRLPTMKSAVYCSFALIFVELTILGLRNCKGLWMCGVRGESLRRHRSAKPASGEIA